VATRDRTTAPLQARATGLARVLALPLWAHAGALALVLLALLPFIGTRASWSVDEGLAITQAQALHRGDGWLVAHPVPEADPTGNDYPYERALWGDRGVAPYGKHPLYAAVLAGADGIGGVPAMVLLSLLAVVAAAVLTARIAESFDPRYGVPALWFAGLASPLAIDGYLVFAHTLATALTAGAALLAVRTRREPTAPVWTRAAAVALLLGVATALRTEALLFAVALAVAVSIAARADVARRTALALIACGALAGAGAAVVLERAARLVIVGPIVAAPAQLDQTGGGNFLAARLRGFGNSFLRPSYGGGGIGGALLLVAVGCLAAALVATRRSSDGETDESAVRLFVVIAAAAVVARLVLADPDAVPGLLVACPLLWLGIACVRRATWSDPVARLLAITGGGFTVLVLVGQYAAGAGLEWGGRYLALALPVLVPLAVAGLHQAATRLTPETRRVALASLAVVALGLTAVGLSELHHTHAVTADVVDRVGAFVADEESPVVVTSNPALPALAWQTAPHQRWLLASPERASDADLAARLAAAGVHHVTLVTGNLARDSALVAGARTGPVTMVHGWAIVPVDLP
jgi:hypothetical protein